MGAIFRNRKEAGEVLALKLEEYFKSQEISTSDLIILGLLRGGYIIAQALSQRLGEKAYPYFVKKLGMPDWPEYGIGAVGEEEYWVDWNYAKRHGVSKEYIEERIAALREEIKKQKRTLSYSHKPSLKDRIVILADDGIATGYTSFLAILEVRKKNPQDIIVATPVIPPATLLRLETWAKVVYLEAPQDFRGVGDYYQNFRSVSLKRIKGLLAK